MISQLFTQYLANQPGNPEVVRVVASGRGTHKGIQWYRGVEGQQIEYRDHQGEEKHQKHPDNDSSDQFLVIINLGKR